MVLLTCRFKGYLEEVVERALSAGVQKVMVTGTTVENSQTALLLARTLPGVMYSTAGVHPHSAKVCDINPLSTSGLISTWTFTLYSRLLFVHKHS